MIEIAESDTPDQAHMGDNYFKFKNELMHLLNRYSMENGCNTPDFILATYLTSCLDNFNMMVLEREKWYGRENQSPGIPKL